MNQIVISADSTSDLSVALKERYGFQTIPLYVNLGEESYKDGEEIAPEQIYRYVAAHRQLPKTSACPVADYLERFSEWVRAGKSVVHLNLSSKMSAAYQNARLAAAEVGGDVQVIDSANLSTGTALLLLDAWEKREQGKSAAEIGAEIRKRVPLVRASFVVDTLDYLKMGGRCSAVAALGANLLKLHPRIYVADGTMGVGEKYRGGIDAVIVRYVEQMLEQNQGKIRRNRCFITHTRCQAETVELVKHTVERQHVFDEILETDAGCVITSHCGPGTLGILFEVEE